MSVKETIEKRRAYRSLDSVEITRELIEDLAEVARITPSCANKQPWRFVFVYDKNKLSELFTALSEGNKWVKKASMIIGVFTEPQNDCIIGERLYYLFDTGMATAFIILRATELGLVAHPIAGFKEELAKEILSIPKELRLITLIVVGKHSEIINPVLSDSMKLGETQRPPRKFIDEFIYINKVKKQVEKIE
ncbi:MAG: nitroreductase family protein [Candidatus Lokiarchaeota archaeon]|nr:nitroreductase family protein [Candidatus Lokiarchaeota archaeon]